MSSTIADPEVLAFIEKTEGFYPAANSMMSVADQRHHYDRMCASFRRPRPASVGVENGVIEGPDGLISIRRYWPARPGPARVIYYHGGGFVVGGLDSHDDVCAEISEASAVEVVSVDYRLCPEHPHPAAYLDALAAVDGLSDRPLVVAGDSAGGNLAAAVALARPRKIWGQVLIYPGLGGEALDLMSYSERRHAPLLSADDIGFYARMRADGMVPEGDPTFTPLSAKSFADVPPCFVSSAEHDPLRDDGPEYVLRLTDAGIAAEAVIEAELPHGHLRARASSTRAAEAFARICAAITKFSAGP